jgi:hypothetical protein
MAIARRKPERVKQIYSWLIDNFATPYPTRLVARKPRTKSESQLQGWVIKDGRHLVIHLNMRLPKYVLIDTLIHEMAHCITWGHQSMVDYTPEHSEEWGIYYSKIYRAFFDEGGAKDSGLYK